MHADYTLNHDLLRTPEGLALHRVARADLKAGAATLLLVHGYGQNRHAWHLPSRSFTHALAEAGFTVYSLELRGHGDSEGSSLGRARNVHDYVTLDLPSAVRTVRKTMQANERLFLLGHSLGGLVCYAAAPDLADLADGIVTLGSPLLFSKGATPLFVLSHLLRQVERVPGLSRDGKVPLSLFRHPVLRASRMLDSKGLLGAIGRAIAPIRPFHPGTIEPHVLEEHVDLAFDATSVGVTFHMFEWARNGRFATDAHDYRHRFASWRKPLLVIAGTYDELAPPPGVRAAKEATLSPDCTFLEVPHGHIDMLVGTHARANVWTPVIEWLQDRAKAR